MTTQTGTATPQIIQDAGSGTPSGGLLTYDLASDDPTVVNRSRLRLIINDITYQSGPKPNGENFSDIELDQLMIMEGGNVGAAAALAFETLTSAWATVAERIGLGPETYESAQARRYRELAAVFRKQYGASYSNTNGTANIISWADSFNQWYPGR